MRKRINISLPEETLELIDRVTEHGDRSRFIDEAVRHNPGNGSGEPPETAEGRSDPEMRA